jgi:CDP-diacylglycerol---glycerol-3-phosphate 3-phosphatidyltransferase
LAENISKPKEDQTLTLTDIVRKKFKGILDPIAAFLNQLGLLPNTVTIFGLFGNLIGAIFIAYGELAIGGVIILLMGPIDALDGTMARLRGMSSKFGAFVDSVTDRYSEFVIFAGLLYYFAVSNKNWMVLVVFMAMAGSFLVSYIRSKGESLGWDTKVGLLTRMERYLILSPALTLTFIFGDLSVLIGITIIAVFANVTAIQRIVDIRRQAQFEAVKKKSSTQ